MKLKKKKRLYFIINIFIPLVLLYQHNLIPELDTKLSKVTVCMFLLINKNFIIRTFCKYSSKKPYFLKSEFSLYFINFYQITEICIILAQKEKFFMLRIYIIINHCAFHKTYKCKTIPALLPRTLAPNSKIIRHHKKMSLRNFY